MALLKIRTWPDDVLRRIAEPITAPDERIHRLVEDMRETMYRAPGVGLAAPQIGESIRLIVVDPSAGKHEGHFRAVVNPEIVAREGDIEFEEGCLSVPGETALVKRAARIHLKGLTPDGETLDEWIEEFPAVIFQHEIDHLDGKLFVDRLGQLKRKTVYKRLKKGSRTDARYRAESAL